MPLRKGKHRISRIAHKRDQLIPAIANLDGRITKLKDRKLRSAQLFYRILKSKQRRDGDRLWELESLFAFLEPENPYEASVLLNEALDHLEHIQCPGAGIRGDGGSGDLAHATKLLRQVASYNARRLVWTRKKKWVSRRLNAHTGL